MTDGACRSDYVQFMAASMQADLAALLLRAGANHRTLTPHMTLGPAVQPEIAGHVAAGVPFESLVNVIPCYLSSCLLGCTMQETMCEQLQTYLTCPQPLERASQPPLAD